MKNKKTYIILASVAVLALVAYFLFGGEKQAGVTYGTAEVKVGDITNSVTATGTIEPVTSVTVGTQVSGKVAHLYVDYNSVVKKGQVIAELDKTNLMSELASAKANLSSAQSNLSYQQSHFNRYQILFNKGLISANDYEQTRLSYEQAQQQVRTARESVNKAATNLGYATITSPIDGVVLSKSVEEGQTVAASFNTPELFTIAQDLTNMQVIADIDEADIGEVKEGQRVTFTVDAYPDDVFSGVVKQVRQEATTESNVVTYQVVISAPNANLKLKPGLTANVTIFTKEVKNVLSVPSKALKFTPNEKMLTDGQSIQDVPAPNKVWTLEDGVFKAHKVEVGLTNGITTEITSGLKAGQKVVTEFQIGGGDEPAEGAKNNNPFMPKPRSSQKSGKSAK
ncbi:MAG: efflux RND transporter periplasmic adaptor subunit [Prevotella sp.]|jgi:HlyD family secretion protein|nr:efflux RND transporter periplasmic adaptor subunit [Prevotella sp.]MBQ2535011.1 efflux RND transporter periplasmic adaptor subunit [Prevotella sp.]